MTICNMFDFNKPANIPFMPCIFPRFGRSSLSFVGHMINFSLDYGLKSIIMRLDIPFLIFSQIKSTSPLFTWLHIFAVRRTDFFRILQLMIA